MVSHPFRGGAVAALAALLLCSPAAAQTAFPAGEAAALQLKQEGDYRGTSAAFLGLLDAARGDARSAALAEYYAVMAFQMAQPSGAVEEFSAAIEAAERGELARAHPTLADRLSMLRLQAAATTGDVEGMAERTKALGFVQDWWITGPFDNERGGGYSRAFEPEKALNLQASYEGKKRPVRWRRLPVDLPPGGRIDLDAMVRPNDQVLCYVATCLEADRDREVVLRLGSDEAFAVFLNGARVGGRDVSRVFAYDQDAVGLSLRAGPNLLLLKICEQEGRFEFAARLTAPSGAPLAGVQVRSDEDSMQRAAVTEPAPGAAAEPSLGALTLLAQSVANGGPPQDAFRLSYLLATAKADDPTDRRDHRLARIAAAGMPAEPAARYMLAFTRILSGASAAEKEDNARRHDYEEILRTHPDHVQALLALAQMELDSTGTARRAETLLRRALDQNADFVPARLQLARALHDLGLAPLAQREVVRACQTDAGARGWPAAETRMGDLLAEENDFGGALEHWSRALATAYSPPLALKIADVQMRCGRRDEALATLDRATEVTPFERDPRSAMATLLEAEGNTADALATLRAWLVICPEDDDTMVRIARLDGLAGDVEAQRESLRIALELNPNRKTERRQLEFLQADEKPFYNGFELNGDDVIAADPGPPADAQAQNDPSYWLLRQRVVRAYRNGTTSEYRHSIVRILSDEGARRQGEQMVEHHYGEQRARLLEVRVIKKNGDVQQPRMRGWYVKLPPLEAGDTIEVRARVDDVAPTFFGDYFGLQHGFGAPDGAPCRRSILAVSLEKGRHYEIQAANGAPAGDVTTNANGDAVWAFEMSDLPRTVVEVRRPSPAETDPLVRITTYRDWNHFSSWWWNLIRKQTEVSPAIREKVEELTADLTDDASKIAAIYDFVTTEIRYTAWEFGVHGYKPYSTPVIFERRHGDCKDKSLLLNAMLSVIGVEAYPVLIRADDPRSADDLSVAMVGHFNHCISYLPPQNGRAGRYLDGTATYHPVDTLPSMDQGASVLVVRGERGDVEQIDWSKAADNRDQVELTVDLTAAGDARVHLVQTPLRNQAVSLRNALGNEPGKRREKLERRLASNFGKVQVQSIQCSDLLDMAQPVRLEIDFEAKSFAARQDDGLVLKAAVERPDLTPLTRAETRQMALLLGVPESGHRTLRYRLPEGYVPVQIPPPTEITTPFGSFSMTWTSEGRELRVERELRLETHRIEPAEYPEFREFASAVDQAHRQVVVIRDEEGRR